MGPANAVVDDLPDESTPPPDVAQSQIQPTFIWNGDRVVQQSTLPRSLTGLQSGQTPLPADAQANDFNGLSPTEVIHHPKQLHDNEAGHISQQDASGEQALASQNQHLGGLVDRPADTTCFGQHVTNKSTAADLQTPTQDSTPGTSDSAFQDSTISGALPTINADALGLPTQDYDTPSCVDPSGNQHAEPQGAASNNQPAQHPQLSRSLPQHGHSPSTSLPSLAGEHASPCTNNNLGINEMHTPELERLQFLVAKLQSELEERQALEAQLLSAVEASTLQHSSTNEPPKLGEPETTASNPSAWMQIDNGNHLVPTSSTNFPPYPAGDRALAAKQNLNSHAAQFPNNNSAASEPARAHGEYQPSSAMLRSGAAIDMRSPLPVQQSPPLQDTMPGRTPQSRPGFNSQSVPNNANGQYQSYQWEPPLNVKASRCSDADFNFQQQNFSRSTPEHDNANTVNMHPALQGKKVYPLYRAEPAGLKSRNTKSKPPAVSTLSPSKGHDVDQWSRDMMSYLRGRRYSDIFLALASGRAMFKQELSGTTDGLLPNAAALVRWARATRSACSRGTTTSMLRGASAYTTAITEFAQDHPIDRVVFLGDAEEIAEIDNFIFDAIRTECHESIRGPVVDHGGVNLGFGLIVLLHNDSFQGIKVESQLNQLYQKFLRNKPRTVRPEEHHRSLRALMNNYLSMSGGTHMFNTLELLLQALWQTYAGYEGAAAERRLFETCCKQNRVPITCESTMEHIEEWQNDLQASSALPVTAALTAQATTPVPTATFDRLVAAVTNQLQKRGGQPSTKDVSKELASAKKRAVGWIDTNGLCVFCKKPGKGHVKCGNCWISCLHGKKDCMKNWHKVSETEYKLADTPQSKFTFMLGRNTCPKCEMKSSDHFPWNCPKNATAKQDTSIEYVHKQRQPPTNQPRRQPRGERTDVQQAAQDIKSAAAAVVASMPSATRADVESACLSDFFVNCMICQPCTPDEPLCQWEPLRRAIAERDGLSDEAACLRHIQFPCDDALHPDGSDSNGPLWEDMHDKKHVDKLVSMQPASGADDNRCYH